MATMMRRPEKIRIARAPVISAWARRFLLPKKKVKPMVTTAPKNKVNQMTPGTMPWATAIRARRACVRRSSCASAAASTTGPRASLGSARRTAR